MLLQDKPLTRICAETALTILLSIGETGASIYDCRFHSLEIVGSVLLNGVSRIRELCGGFVLLVFRRGIHFAKVRKSGRFWRRGVVRGRKHAEYLGLYNVESTFTGFRGF